MEQFRFYRRGLAGAWRVQPLVLFSLLAIAALLFAFGYIAEEVLEGEPIGLDRTLLLALRQPGNPSAPIGPPWLQEAARDVTSLGSTTVLGIITTASVIYAYLIRKRAAALLMLGAVVGGTALSTLLKIGFARPRPELVAPAARVFTASFPSGHATMSAITYLALGALLARTQPVLRLRVFLMTLAVLLTVLVGVSRIYLGVHYPTDVLAGWCIGAAWALVCWVLMVWLQQRGKVEPPGEGQGHD
jgi:undecaprenyl-diphosphatase